MKPKTKLQMEIVNGSRKLAPVSEAQKRYAYKHCFVHYFKRDAKGNCFCLDCGHTWRDKEDKKNCKCPHCGLKNTATSGTFKVTSSGVDYESKLWYKTGKVTTSN